MNTTRAIILAVIAALGVGLYLLTRSPDPVPETEAVASQDGMSGMSGMAGMEGLGGMEGMAANTEATTPDCTRYDLIDGVWVCTAPTAASGN